MKHIELSQGQYALVDDEDYRWLSAYKWYAGYYLRTKSFYAARYPSGGRQAYMHRAILGLKKGDDLYSDHINHDTLDNRRCNLRVVTNRQNLQNRKKPGTSRFPGVSWHKRWSKWRASIWDGKKRVFLGYFRDELKAAQAYRDACPDVQIF